MKIQLTLNQLKELSDRGYTTDQMFLLKAINEGLDISEILKSSKWSALHFSLKRKGLILENENKPTLLGLEILVFIDSKDGRRMKKVATQSTDFDLWWDAYPGTPDFTYKGKTFTGDRSIRVGRDDCMTKFNKVILEGIYSAKDMIDALKYEVWQKKENSIKTGTNKIAFMQSTLTYLNQKGYIEFIKKLKEGAKIEETSKSLNGGTDI